MQTENTGPTRPYTIARALDAGWSWRIPLQHRTGNGYVYSSRFSGDDEARALLLRGVQGSSCTEPRIIPFKTGLRKKIWNRNCLALGLASGFLEPLESTGIHLIYKTLTHFIRNFPDLDFDPLLQRQFEQCARAEHLAARDFLILHYCTTRRGDTGFWRWCQNMQVPESLAEKIESFRARGLLGKTGEGLFGNASWYAVLDGMGIEAGKYNPLVDTLDGGLLAKSLRAGRRAIADYVQRLPSHNEFLLQACPAREEI